MAKAIRKTDSNLTMFYLQDMQRYAKKMAGVLSKYAWIIIRTQQFYSSKDALPTLKSTVKSSSVGVDEGASDVATGVTDNNCGFFTPNNEIDFSKVKVEDLFADQVDFETFSKSDFRAVKVKECVAVPKSKKLLQFTLDDGTGTDRTILSGIRNFYEPEDLVGKTLIAITNLPPRAMMGIESCGMLLSAVHEEEGEEKLNLLMVDNHIPAGAKLY